jgi:hypothetical protein
MKSARHLPILELDEALDISFGLCLFDDRPQIIKRTSFGDKAQSSIGQYHDVPCWLGELCGKFVGNERRWRSGRGCESPSGESLNRPCTPSDAKEGGVFCQRWTRCGSGIRRSSGPLRLWQVAGRLLLLLLLSGRSRECADRREIGSGAKNEIAAIVIARFCADRYTLRVTRAVERRDHVSTILRRWRWWLCRVGSRDGSASHLKLIVWVDTVGWRKPDVNEMDRARRA